MRRRLNKNKTMNKGIGIDLVEVPRIRKLIKKDNKFINKVFEENEVNYCEKRKHKAIHYAARFAAKEAFLKAMGKGWYRGMTWKDISVENDSMGKPELKLTGKAFENFKEMEYNNISLSISHTKEVAIALVMIE